MADLTDKPSASRASSRPDGRAFDALRPVEMIPGFHRPSEGSVLYRAGGTVVLCTASVEGKVPPFLEGKGKGWLTSEYQMHPRANPPRRESRDGRGKAPSGRTLEIQRLVGRALRAGVDLDKLGERTITIDSRRACCASRSRRPAWAWSRGTRWRST
jgi:ribonuclease PH